MKISVTQQDIESGVINSLSAGPLALAARRSGLLGALVGKHTVRWPVKGIDGQVKWLISALPIEAVRFQEKLETHDRHEVLAMLRKGGTFWHSPVTFEVPIGIPVLNTVAHHVGRKAWTPIGFTPLM